MPELYLSLEVVLESELDDLTKPEQRNPASVLRTKLEELAKAAFPEATYVSAHAEDGNGVSV